MRKTLAAIGFISSLLVCAQANATIVILGPGVNSDPALGPILSPPIPSTSSYETFDGTKVGQTGTFSTSFATFSGTGVVVNGSVSGQYAAPFMGPGIPDPTNYLATSGPEQETITFATTHNVFALFWGSIDTYNHISFYNGSTLLATFGGHDVLPPANGNQGSFATNADVEFSNLGAFNKIVLQSGTPAFEIDNLQVDNPVLTPPVPEPSTWLMMILGFFGVGFVAYRRKSNMMSFRIA